MTVRTAKLGNVIEINPRSNHSLASDSNVAFLSMADISEDGQILATQTRPLSEVAKGYTSFQNGDVLLAKITPCFENGKSTVFQNLFNGIGAGTTELHIVRPLGGIERRYVLLFLKTPAFLKEGEAVMTGSAGQKRLPRSYFECKPFPLPPLAEQQRIVARLDRVAGLVEARARATAAMEADLQAMLAYHRQQASKLTIALTPVEDPTAFGLVETEAGGRIRRFLEKPRPEDVTTDRKSVV